MTIVIFVVILAILIVSHELGHFLAAKWSGIRVDEFGLGFPPRLFGFTKGETTYSLNIIPFGGFVKIFGENPDDESISGADSKRSLVNKPRWIQAIVLAAGITFNLILAWLVISLGFAIGLPTPEEEAQTFAYHTPAKLLIAGVMPESPAEAAGIRAGDEIVSLSSASETLSGELQVAAVQEFIASRPEQKISLSYRRGAVFKNPDLPVEELTVVPETGIVGEQAAIGVSLDRIAIARASIPRALWEGLTLTIDLTYLTAKSILFFIIDAFRGEGALSAVTGPVGLVGLVGDARTLGFVYLLSFMAIISINLAVINLIPFPALDGGRLLFLLIEKVKGSAIKPSVANKVNLVGFALLLLLMAVVTYSDIAKLFS